MTAGLARTAALCPDALTTAERLAAQQAIDIRAVCARCDAWPLMRPERSDARIALPVTRNDAIYAEHADDPLHWWSLTRISAAFAARTCTPPALLDAVFARIDQLDRRLNSFVVVDRVGATTAAQASATRWARGVPLGALDGVPVGIKDVIDVAGLPTRCHSRATSPKAVTRDAAIVARLRAAGAVIVGKLATHEFAIGGPAFDLPIAPARNPWNRDHHPGGSSSGAGAAVAAGLVPLAIGTDTAGSVRNPASACGIVGLKPGRGGLALDGVVPLAPTLDHIGLLTRSAPDMRVAAAVFGMHAAAADVDRVGFVRHFHDHDMLATPEVAAALDRVAAALGASVVTLPPLGDFALVNRIILQTEGYAAHGHHLRDRPEELSALTRTALLPGAFVTAETLALALRAKAALTTAVDAALVRVDMLLTASSMEPPCRIDDPDEIARTYMLQARSPFNVTGHPALAMIAGVSATGLPLSVQFAARMGDEARLIAAASRWEQAMGGPLRPPIA